MKNYLPYTLSMYIRVQFEMSVFSLHSLYQIIYIVQTNIEKNITNTDFLLVNPFDVFLFDCDSICAFIHCTLIGTFA